MNQEEINEVMWKSLPEWHKEQLREEHKNYATHSYKYDPEIIPSKDEFEEDFEYETCGNCSGSGEGLGDGSTCHVCRGTGVERYKKEFK